MPPLIEEYLQRLLDAVAACPIVQSSNVALDKRTTRSALIRGELQFADGSMLHFRELVELENEVIRRMYSYHYQDKAASLIFRYDDTHHFPELSGFPHHKHIGQKNQVVSGAAPDFSAELHEIEVLYPIRDQS